MEVVVWISVLVVLRDVTPRVVCCAYVVVRRTNEVKTSTERIVGMVGSGGG